MKKNLFGWLAMATMLVGTGCSSDEVVNDYSPENAIQFGTYVGKNASSRASVITEEGGNNGELSLQRLGFGVFAYYSGRTAYTSGGNFTPNFMNNEQVVHNGTAWEYSPLKYWPNNSEDKVSFIAYAPWEEGFTFDNGNVGKYTFTVADEVTDQIDFLWSKSQNFNVTKQAVGGNVTFNFAHALSKIGFTINAGVDVVNKGGSLDPNTTIYVDKVTLGSLNNIGTLDMSKDIATWSVLSGEKIYTWDYTHGGNANELTNNILTAGSQFGDGKELPLINNNAFLMTIPQTANITIEVTYRVFTQDTNLGIPMDGNTALVPEQSGINGSLITNVIPVTINNQTFDAGKQYTFNIILGMTSVKIDAVVENWDPTSSDHWFNQNV